MSNSIAILTALSTWSVLKRKAIPSARFHHIARRLYWVLDLCRCRSAWLGSKTAYQSYLLFRPLSDSQWIQRERDSCKWAPGIQRALLGPLTDDVSFTPLDIETSCSFANICAMFRANLPLHLLSFSPSPAPSKEEMGSFLPHLETDTAVNEVWILMSILIWSTISS